MRELTTNTLREIGHVSALESALAAYKTHLLTGTWDREGSRYRAVLNAAYDLTEIAAVYDELRSITPDPDEDRSAMRRAAYADYRMDLADDEGLGL